MTTPAPAAPAAKRAAHFAAQAALLLRDRVLSAASHDLRSPLNAMHNLAYVLGAFARREMLRERSAWTLAHGGTFAHGPFAHGERAVITLTLPCEAPV